MKEKTIVLPWQDILKIASGKDENGIPRSAASIAIDKIINEKETQPLKDVFLENAVINIHASGGAVIVTLDFPYDQTACYRNCKKMCDEWLAGIDNDSRTDEQMYLCIVPYVLEGQIALYYNQLMFAEGFEIARSSHRLILGFDNNETFAMEVEGVDYNHIVAKINEELAYYEQQIHEEIEHAIEEEKKAREEENVVDIEMQKKLNNPLSMDEKIVTEKVESENMKFTEENETVRFVDN